MADNAVSNASATMLIPKAIFHAVLPEDKINVVILMFKVFAHVILQNSMN